MFIVVENYEVLHSFRSAMFARSLLLAAGWLGFSSSKHISRHRTPKGVPDSSLFAIYKHFTPPE